MARPRKHEALNIRARAIDEATALLGSGRGVFSLAEVAGRIGCSAPALYAYFGGKDDLLRAVRAEVFARLTAAKAARYATPCADPIARLRAGGHEQVAFAAANPALYRLLYAPRHDAGAEPPAISEAALEALTAGVRAAQMAGFAPGADARTVALTLWFMVHGAILMALDGQLPGPDAARWARAHEAVDTTMALLTPAGTEAR